MNEKTKILQKAITENKRTIDTTLKLMIERVHWDIHAFSGNLYSDLEVYCELREKYKGEINAQKYDKLLLQAIKEPEFDQWYYHKIKEK